MNNPSIETVSMRDLTIRAWFQAIVQAMTDNDTDSVEASMPIGDRKVTFEITVVAVDGKRLDGTEEYGNE